MHEVPVPVPRLKSEDTVRSEAAVAEPGGLCVCRVMAAGYNVGKGEHGLMQQRT